MPPIHSTRPFRRRADFTRALPRQTEKANTITMDAQTLPSITVVPGGSSARTPTLSGFERILVPIDFSAPSLRALHYSLALSAGAIQLIHAAEPAGAAFEAIPYMLPETERIAQLEASLTKIAGEHATAGISLTSTVRAGNPSEEIAKLATSWPAQLLVLSTHGRTGLSHLLLGSVAEKIVRQVVCPILVLRKHQRDFVPRHPGQKPKAKLDKILVPVNFTSRSNDALRFAVEFAWRFGGRITLVHCIHPPGFGHSDLSALDAATALEGAKALAEDKLRALLAEEVPNDLAAGMRVLEGPPLGEIPRFAAEENFDLIACGTHARSGVRHALLGSTAEGLVRHAPCPVLIVPAA